jgi:hypothetical protein
MASVRRATSAYAWARSAVRSSCDSEGRDARWSGTPIDIDVHRKTVAEFRDRERELSQLVDMVPIHIWRLNRDGEPNFFNKRLRDFLGLDIGDEERPKKRADWRLS